MEQMDEIQSTGNLDSMNVPGSRQFNDQTWQLPLLPFAQIMEQNEIRIKCAEVKERNRLRRELDALRSGIQQRDAELEQLRKSNALIEWKMKLMTEKDESGRFSELFKATDELQQLRKNMTELKELQQTVTCSICMVARCTTAFQCGHLLCAFCSFRLNQCHICRLPIVQRTFVFL